MQVAEHIYKFFADYIFAKTGITYEKKDYYRLDSRFKDLMEFFELSSVDDLYDKYKTNISTDMHAVLINFSTNNETFFFRDVKPFKVLTKHILPEIMENNKFGLINIWCCASSTGQEPLSICMQIKDKLGDDKLNKIMLTATDISAEALAKAKKGVYNGLDVQRGLPITSLMSHFEQLDNEDWKANINLMSKIKYGEFNLLTDNYKSDAYHVIFCRNVLIYQTKENKEVILRNLYKALKPGGYLLLGNGESLIGLKLDFVRHTHDGLTIYKKEEGL